MNCLLKEAFLPLPFGPTMVRVFIKRSAPKVECPVLTNILTAQCASCSHVSCVKEEKELEIASGYKMDKKLLAVSLICVLLGISSVECIVGGHTSLPDAAPYMVSVQNPTHICGGVLVGASWALTTAACVQGKTNLKVLVGSNRLLTNMERVAVSNTIVHSQYNSTSGINNIALLKTSKAVTSTRVSVITLNDVDVTTGTTTVFYGWGSLNYGSSAKSNELQALYQKTLSATDCAKKYQSIGTLQTGHICAQIQQGQAACSKDQGGPLVGYSSKKLLGIYDYGVQCSGKYPDVFVDISKFKTWIDSTMASN